MKKMLMIATIAFLGTLLCASVSSAAEAKTEYFTLTLPGDWKQPKPTQKANGATATIVVNTKDRTAVSVTITPVSLPAKELATQTLNNMKTGGFKTTEPKAVGDFYVGEFSKGPAKGVSYFGSNGKVGSVITVLGSTLDSGKKLLNENFKSDDAKLFPSSF